MPVVLPFACWVAKLAVSRFVPGGQAGRGYRGAKLTTITAGCDYLGTKWAEITWGAKLAVLLAKQKRDKFKGETG